MGVNVPLVSVVVPFLDPPLPFFREAIESVQAQTLTDWELVLVDDGSGAEARALADGLASRDSRIRVVASEPPRPAGISGARNAGLARAHGEFLAMLDADDVWKPEHLRRHVDALRRRPDVAMVCSEALHWSSWAPGAGADGDFVPDTPGPYGLYEPPEFATGVILGTLAVPCPCSVTVRRSIVMDLGGYEASWTSDRRLNSMYEDQVFYVKLGGRHPVLRLPDVLELYRLHPDSVTGAADERSRHEARTRFLGWCEGAGAAELPAPDRRAVRRAARTSAWRLRHPHASRLGRLVRKAVGRLGGMR